MLNVEKLKLLFYTYNNWRRITIMVLENFKTYTVTSGLPTMTVSNYGVSFSKAAVVRLGKPEYAKLLINSEEKIFAVQVSSEADEDANVFYRKKVTILSLLAGTRKSCCK